MSDGVVTREEYHRDMKRIDDGMGEQSKRITEAEKKIVSLETFWRVLSDVPKNTERIREEQIKISSTFTNFQCRLDEMNEKIDEQKEIYVSSIADSQKWVEKELEEINKKVDESNTRMSNHVQKFNINLLDFFRDNGWKVLAILGSGYIFFAEVIVKFFC